MRIKRKPLSFSCITLYEMGGGNLDDLFYYLWLSTIEGVGVRTKNSLLDKFKSPKTIYEMSQRDFEAAGVSKSRCEQIAASKNKMDIKGLINELNQKEIRCITIADSSYPERLRNIFDSPIILYIKGKLPLEDTLHISVIGARKCSEYGGTSAFSISRDLAREGVVIVSGMADGVDSMAHKGAIAGGGKTIAVLGCGVDICYPNINRVLMGNIINNGCVISEYPPKTKPFKYNFPARNRIISGMCDGLLVVEAGAKSGTLITVDFALEHGKDVFALPGNITSDVSVGTNSLIKQGAVLAANAEHILEEMAYKGVLEGYTGKIYKEDPVNLLDSDEKNLYHFIKKEPVDVETLVDLSGLCLQEVIYILTCLEIKGVVKKLPGNRYIRD